MKIAKSHFQPGVWLQEEIVESLPLIWEPSVPEPGPGPACECWPPPATVFVNIPHGKCLPVSLQTCGEMKNNYHQHLLWMFGGNYFKLGYYESS